jgi:succinate dehydrogenase / fumarate reductase cytochrome b subunit
MCLFYIVSLLALALHTSHGFWSLFQSLGVNHPSYNTFLRQGAIIVSILGAAFYIAIPVVTFLFNNFLL